MKVKTKLFVCWRCLDTNKLLWKIHCIHTVTIHCALWKILILKQNRENSARNSVCIFLLSSLRGLIIINFFINLPTLTLHEVYITMMAIFLADINSIQKSVKGLEILTKGVGFTYCNLPFSLFLEVFIPVFFFKQSYETNDCIAVSKLAREIIQNRM